MAKEELTRIEWKLMNICWNLKKATARNVYDEMQKSKIRSYQAIKTMLDRLVAKNFLTRERFGPIWIYEPAISREKVLNHALGNFMDVVLENRLLPVISYFTGKERLSKEEVAALKKIIDQNEKEDENDI